MVSSKSHIPKGGYYLEHFLIILGLGLVQLGCGINVIFQIPAHMLPCLQTLDQQARCLLYAKYTFLQLVVVVVLTNLASILADNAFIVARRGRSDAVVSRSAMG